MGAKQKPLALVDVSCAFVIFGMGTGLAVVAVFIENLFSRVYRKWNSKKNWPTPIKVLEIKHVEKKAAEPKKKKEIITNEPKESEK